MLKKITLKPFILDTQDYFASYPISLILSWVLVVPKIAITIPQSVIYAFDV